MRALPTLLATAFACVAVPTYAEVFRGLGVGDFANVPGYVLGEALREESNDRGVTVTEYLVPGEQRVLVWHGPDHRIMALRAIEYRSDGGIEIGVSTAGEMLSRIGGRAALARGDTFVAPIDGFWTWRVTWPLAGEPREYLQLTFTADTRAPDHSTTYVPDEAILSAIMVMSTQLAAQSIDLATLGDADQRRLGGTIRDVLNQ